MFVLDTQDWGDELFGALKAAGGKAYSNYAVGFNNVRPMPPGQPTLRRAGGLLLLEGIECFGDSVF